MREKGSIEDVIVGGLPPGQAAGDAFRIGVRFGVTRQRVAKRDLTVSHAPSFALHLIRPVRFFHRPRSWLGQR